MRSFVSRAVSSVGRALRHLVGGVEVDVVNSSSSCWVYIIESIKNKRLYIGCTKDVLERLQRHNGGSVKSTKQDAPYRLLYYEEHCSVSAARKKELYLKSFKKPSYLRSFVSRAVSSVGRAPDF